MKHGSLQNKRTQISLEGHGLKFGSETLRGCVGLLWERAQNPGLKDFKLRLIVNIWALKYTSSCLNKFTQSLQEERALLKVAGETRSFPTLTSSRLSQPSPGSHPSLERPALPSTSHLSMHICWPLTHPQMLPVSPVCLGYLVVHGR